MPGYLRPLSSGRPKILSHISGIQILSSFFFGHGFLQRADLLGFGKFRGCSGIGGFVGGGFPDFRLGIVCVLRAIAGHMTL